MRRKPPDLKFFFLVALIPFLVGMAGRNLTGKGELKPELRLKLYNEAIGHFEKAKAHWTQGRAEEALKEIRKATAVVKAFPEAYQLARTIYLQTQQPQKVRREEELFRQYEGEQGASLYRLRDQVMQEIEVRRQFAPPPDFDAGPAFMLLGLAAAILIFGMIFERLATRGLWGRPDSQRSLILERFPEEEEEAPVSWFFKVCGLLLPGPLIFLLLVGWGLRNYSEIVPVLLFGWILVDLAIHLIFFADLSGLGGLGSRRPPGG